jgi:hypothetical protein
MLTEYDRRQLQRVVQCIDDYHSGQLPLSALVSSLEGLFGALESVTPDQRNDFLRRWAVLDEVLAVSLDERRGLLNVGEQALIRGVLAELRDMCQQV